MYDTRGDSVMFIYRQYEIEKEERIKLNEKLAKQENESEFV